MEINNLLENGECLEIVLNKYFNEKMNYKNISILDKMNISGYLSTEGYFLVFRILFIFNNMNNSIDNIDYITIIIPSIGRETLKNSIQSLLNQTLNKWNAIIIYDGCKNILDSDLLNDKRISYYEIEKMDLLIKREMLEIMDCNLLKVNGLDF